MANKFAHLLTIPSIELQKGEADAEACLVNKLGSYPDLLNIWPTSLVVERNLRP